MVSRLPLIDDDGEVRDLSEVDMSLFRPAHEVLPVELQEALGMHRRTPQEAPTKVPVTLRVDADVLAALKATGPGWQRRANDALRADLAAGRLS